MTGFTRILVPTDFGASADRALHVAVELCDKLGASLTLLHVCELPMYAYSTLASVPGDFLMPISEAAQQDFEAALVALRLRVPAAKGILRNGVPWEVILAAIDETRADLVVMGTHGRRGIAHILLGSVAEKTVRLSPVPVLTCRAPTETTRT
jgi:nucleotide-binding universal stress UspA family protein